MLDLGSATNEAISRLDTIDCFSASLPLFRALYRLRCIEFDAVYAWEAKTIDRQAW